MNCSVRLLAESRVRPSHRSSSNDEGVDLPALFPRVDLTGVLLKRDQVAAERRRRDAAAQDLIDNPQLFHRSRGSEVEMRHPGWGAIHLGHLTGFKTADAHYFDFGIIARRKPDPEEL